MSRSLSALLARYNGNLPVYMSAHHAESVIERIIAAEPTAARSPRRLLAFLERKGRNGDLEAGLEEFDTDAGERRSPEAYAPAWMGEVDDHLDWGMSLKDGVATINLDDAIPARGHWYCGDWIHGYDSLDLAIRESLADDRVKGIFFRMDSPGGVVHDGINVLTRTLRAAEKPIWVHADMACSAAYWIAAQAERIIAPPTGTLGSIGACIVHMEISRLMKREGVTVRAIESGIHKTGGAPWKPLDDASAAHLQALVDEAADNFFAAVVEGRPELNEADLRELGAQWFGAKHREPTRSALSLGLCDELMSEADTFNALVEHVSGASGAPAQGAAAAAPSTQAGKGDFMSGSRKPAAAQRGGHLAMMKRQRARLDAKIKAEEEEMEGEEEELDAEGEEEDLESEQDQTEAEGDEETTDAEGEEDETTAEGEDEDVDAEGEEEDLESEEDETEMRVRAFQSLPEARGLQNLAASLAREKGVSLKVAKSRLKAARRDMGLSRRNDHPVRGSSSGTGIGDGSAATAASILNAHKLARGER